VSTFAANALSIPFYIVVFDCVWLQSIPPHIYACEVSIDLEYGVWRVGESSIVTTQAGINLLKFQSYATFQLRGLMSSR
jgi:hypothetical protein